MFTRSISTFCVALLAALLLLQMQGPWVVFKLQQQAIRYEIKQQVKAGVPEENLVTLKIARTWEGQNNPRFQRMHSKEFRFDGEMYDIVHSEVHGDTTVYLCIHDVKESGLFARLDEMTGAGLHHPVNEGKRNRIVQWLSMEYCASGITLPQAVVGFTLLTSHSRQQYSSVVPGRFSPPPEGALFISADRGLPLPAVAATPISGEAPCAEAA